MNNIVLALEITALGMGLVFAAIILLWGMMALLTRVTAEKEFTPNAAKPVPIADTAIQARAAAVAVAIAVAEGQTSHARVLETPPTAIVSAWQLGMRTRQLTRKGIPPIRNSRKVG